jgi:hypothetical protein
MKNRLSAIILLAIFVFQSVAFSQAPAVKVTTDQKKVAEGVTAKQLSDYLYFVASDEMEGRDTPSRGLDTTAKFIGMNLSRWGLKPAGDNGTFFQKFAITSETPDPSNNTLTVGGKSFTVFDDYYRLSGNASLNSPMVYVRDGWMIKSKNIDAYRGVDVKGKIVVVYGQGFPRAAAATSMPFGSTQEDLKGTKGTDWADPLTYARTSGAAGMILMASAQTQAAWPQLRNFLGRSSSYPAKLRDNTEEPADFPVMLVSGGVGDAIFAGESGNKESATAFPLYKSISMNVAGRAETKWTQNVVAVLEGSDPVLKNEMVAIGAHYDHVGINANAPGDDKIYNGADDDGSGTVAVLSIAEALAKAPKRSKRSILFVWHCGEEKGLWGSEYFNKFPTVDIKQVVAQLNVDMIGRSRKTDDSNPKNKDLSGENAIYVIGSEMMSSTLGSIVKGANAGYLNLNYDYKYDDPKDPERFFFRSDHFNYALSGIPISFWFDGVHEDYHKPGDEPQKIDYNKMEKVARTILITLLSLSDLKERPKIDKQLPPELKQR